MTKEEITKLFRAFHSSYIRIDYWGSRQYKNSFNSTKFKAIISSVLENPFRFLKMDNTIEQTLCRVVIALNIKKIYYEEEPIDFTTLKGYYFKGIVWSTEST